MNPTAPSYLSDTEWEELYQPLTREVAFHMRCRMQPDWQARLASYSHRFATVGSAGFFHASGSMRLLT